MSKWRFWHDQYYGTDWNDRGEVSSPEFEGIEIPDEDVEQELLNYYTPEVRELVEIDGNESYIQALLSVCTQCNEPIAWCTCEDTGEDLADYLTYIGFHAEKVN